MQLLSLFNRLTEAMSGEDCTGMEKRVTAYQVVRHLTGCDKYEVIADPGREVSPDEKELQRCVACLKVHTPVEYITGEASFYRNTFRVTPDVLIPRPETEELVDTVLKDHRRQRGLRVLDLCTGSGIIGISLALYLDRAAVTAADISEAALGVARENARRLGAGNIVFRQADALHLVPAGESYDLIVSNPPYVTEKEKASMQPNVLDHEPHLALFVPDTAPLLFYESIARYARKALRPGGRLYFEINENYGRECAAMLGSEGFFGIDLLRDLYGKNRMIRCIHP